MNNFRAPAVPLFLNDPYFSIWSFADALYEEPTRHWTGAKNSMLGLVRYNDKVYRFMGKTADCSSFYYSDVEVIPQKNVTIKPTTTEFIFENRELTVKVNFISPLLPDDLLLLSRPISYMEYEIIPKNDDKEATLYFDIACEASVDNSMQSVRLFRCENGIYCGCTEQKVLAKYGDDCRIDWGYLHLLEKNAYFGKAISVRDAFICNREAEILPEGAECRICETNPTMAVVKHGNHGVIAVGYDDIKSIEYFGNKLDAYYKSNGDTFEDVCRKALADFDEIKNKCSRFDSELMNKARKISKEYAQIIALTYRQTIAAHKLCYDEKGMLFISKECYSNGCAATLDVTYPSVPLILFVAPELVKAMLRPIFDFANTDAWCFDFAPHDVGCYPKVNGQVYGLENDENKFNIDKQMPVEECGNILICTYAVCIAKKSFAYAEENRALLTKWGKYLSDFGFDPGNQLCTDDFGGHLNHNCNLSIKAIIGMYVCGIMFCDKALKEKAKECAKLWKERAYDGDKYKMAFDTDDSWSIKYNMVWDKLFRFNLFDADIYETETKYYEKQMKKYGIPLDYRNSKAKLDWVMWAAALSEDKQYVEKVIHSVWNMICETKQRVPLTDYYLADTGEQRIWALYSSPVGFSNRSVIGGLAILLLKEEWL